MSAFLFSRVSFVIVLACSAAVSYIIGPHAAEAYPNVAPLDSGMEQSLRSYKRYSLHSSETAQSWKAPDGDAPSVIYVQPNLLRKEHLNYNTNSRHTQPHFEGRTPVHGGQNLGEVQPASSTSRMNHNPFFQSQDGATSGFVAPHNGNSQSWFSPVLRKSSQQQRPLPQNPSQVQKAYDYEQIPRSGTSTLPESRSEDRIDRESPNFPESSRSRGFWSSQSNSKGHNSDNKETHAGTSGIQSYKPPSFVNQKSFLLPSASSSIHSSVIKPEKLTSSFTTHLSQGKFPPNGNGKTSYRRVQSYLFQNFHTTEAPKTVNMQNSQQNVQRVQVFNQQTKANVQSANSMLIRNENKFGGHVGITMKYGPASAIYRAPKQDALTPHEDPNSAKTDAEDAKSNLPDSAMKPFENVQPKESYIRPYRLQKYSFGQRVADPKPSSFQEYESANTVKMKNKSGVGSVEQKGDRKLITKSSEVLKLVTLTRLEPQSKLDGTTLTPFNRRHEQGKVKDREFKAITYEDIIGSASFSSVTPAKMVTDYFAKSKTTLPKEMVPQNQTVVLSDVVHETGKAIGSHRNATEDNSVGGKNLDFRKGGIDTELGISDLSVSEKESEAKSVPRGLQSDPEENVESDSLLEMDYLRTSTGNVSFQSLNLHL